MPLVGVLALQGGFAEHAKMAEQVGAHIRLVRKPEELTGLDGIILPGGESTVIDKLARRLGVAEPLKATITAGLPCLATCAGLVYLAQEITGAAPGQQTLGLLNVTVERNAFGRQVDSFQTTLDVQGVGEQVDATFIRAPLITNVGENVEIIAALPGSDSPQIVGVKQGNITALSFHPEQTDDLRIHRWWVSSITPDSH